MDRLRALQYCIAAAEHGSFSAAARRLDVSVAAVAKQITALERQLEVALFERHAHGLTLTAVGSRYLAACRVPLAELDAAGEQARAAASPQLQGTVVLGMPVVVAQECLVPALPQFRLRHPELTLDLRCLTSADDPAASGCDLLVLLGWPEGVGDWVHRPIGGAPLVVAAAPAYWARHGAPKHPNELERHQCLVLRSAIGTPMDLWRFRRGEETVSVRVRGFLHIDNAHRNAMLAAALAGCGVTRMLDWNLYLGHELAQGALVPALGGWESLDVPGVHLLYPPSARRLPRVRAVIDFIAQIFDDLQRKRSLPLAMTSAPPWARSRHWRGAGARLRPDWP